MKHAQNVDLSLTLVPAAARGGGAGSAGDAVLLRVVDDGPGLHGVDVAKLFDDFSAAANTVAIRGGGGVNGSGLGLPICARLTALMGGTLTVRDRPDGTHGVEFAVMLPCGDHAAAAAGGRTPSPHVSTKARKYSGAGEVATPEHAALEMVPSTPGSGGGEGKAAEARPPARARRIVVVDDAPLNRRIAERYAQLLGYECVTLSDGDEVAPAVAATPCDLILMDIRMVRMDGDVACRQLRAGGYTGPIIAVRRLLARAAAAAAAVAAVAAAAAAAAAAARVADACACLAPAGDG